MVGASTDSPAHEGGERRRVSRRPGLPSPAPMVGELRLEPRPAHLRSEVREPVDNEPPAVVRTVRRRSGVRLAPRKPTLPTNASFCALFRPNRVWASATWGTFTPLAAPTTRRPPSRGPVGGRDRARWFPDHAARGVRGSRAATAGGLGSRGSQQERRRAWDPNHEAARSFDRHPARERTSPAAPSGRVDPPPPEGSACAASAFPSRRRRPGVREPPIARSPPSAAGRAGVSRCTLGWRGRGAWRSLVSALVTGERHRRGAWSSARHPRCRRRAEPSCLPRARTTTNRRRHWQTTRSAA